jgi:Fe2+ or Zn2+ uptake regulation protein
LQEGDIIEKLNNQIKFQNDKKRMRKEEISKTVRELVQSINNNGQRLQNDHLYCLSCGEKIQFHNAKNLNYLKCSYRDCSFVLDSTNLQEIILKNLKPCDQCDKDDWGMDYLCFNIEEL